MLKALELITNPEGVECAFSFIQKFPLDYPNYADWLEKCHREMQLFFKRAFVYSEDGVIIGVAVAQQHKDDGKVLEIKNARVEPPYRRKGVFTTLYQAVHSYAKEQEFKRIVLDTHEGNDEVIQTFLSLGFSIVEKKRLYTPKSLEVILKNDLENGTLKHT